MTEEQLRIVENRALSVDEAVLSEAAEYYNPAGAAEVDFADNAPQDVLALVKEVRAQRKRAEDAEAVLARIPMAPLLRFVEAILMRGQPLQFDVDAVERWLKTPPARV